MNLKDFEQISREIRYKLVQISHNTKTIHLGSSLSCVDILVTLYWSVLNIDPKMPDDDHRDRFILSKGHAAPAIFTVLCYRGFFSKSLLDTYAQLESPLEEHPAPNCAPGIEIATGSLGHGLSFACGIALAGKMKNQKFRTFVLLGDGESNEGTVWEAAMFAPAKKLTNLVVIVDYNKWQATGKSNEIMKLEEIQDKWTSFGWEAYRIDGHDLESLLIHLKKKPGDKPIAIIADTIKGKGISFMENDNNWHYRIPTEDEVAIAKKELGLI